MDLLNDRVGKLFRKYLIAACGSALVVSIYTMVDINCRIKEAVSDQLRAIPGMIRVRVLNH